MSGCRTASIVLGWGSERLFFIASDRVAAIDCICADGGSISPMIIFKGLFLVTKGITGGMGMFHITAKPELV